MYITRAADPPISGGKYRVDFQFILPLNIPSTLKEACVESCGTDFACSLSYQVVVDVEYGNWNEYMADMTLPLSLMISSTWQEFAVLNMGHQEVGELIRSFEVRLTKFCCLNRGDLIVTCDIDTVWYCESDDVIFTYELKIADGGIARIVSAQAELMDTMQAVIWFGQIFEEYVVRKFEDIPVEPGKHTLKFQLPEKCLYSSLGSTIRRVMCIKLSVWTDVSRVPKIFFIPVIVAPGMNLYSNETRPLVMGCDSAFTILPKITIILPKKSLPDFGALNDVCWLSLREIL